MTTTSTSPGLTSGSRELRRLNVAMLFAALAAFGLLYSTQALLPAIGADFGVGPTAASLTVSAATGALALAILPLSSVAESVGRVPVMRAGLLVGCLFTFAAAAAPVFWVLVLARGLVGVSLAAVVAVAVAHLGDEVHPAELGTAIGVYVAGNTLGGISGRLIPGLVEESSSWRAAVALLGVVALVAALTFTRLLPAARRTSSRAAGAREHVGAVRDLVRDGSVRAAVPAGVPADGRVRRDVQLPDVPPRGRPAGPVHDRDVAAVPGLPRRHGELAAGRPALGPLRPPAAGADRDRGRPSPGWR